MEYSSQYWSSQSRKSLVFDSIMTNCFLSPMYDWIHSIEAASKLYSLSFFGKEYWSNKSYAAYWLILHTPNNSLFSAQLQHILLTQVYSFLVTCFPSSCVVVSTTVLSSSLQTSIDLFTSCRSGSSRSGSAISSCTSQYYQPRVLSFLSLSWKLSSEPLYQSSWS